MNENRKMRLSTTAIQVMDATISDSASNQLSPATLSKGMSETKAKNDVVAEETCSNSVKDMNDGSACAGTLLPITDNCIRPGNPSIPEHDNESSAEVAGTPLRSAHLGLSRDDPSTPQTTNPSVGDGGASDTTFSRSSTSSSSSKKQSPGERLQRSRERNRIHARKTRQRKKEQMQNLQNRAEALKAEQICLKQSINEKTTASILVALLSKGGASDTRTDDPRVEELLRRPMEQIPDASKLPELPALILPGQHNSKKVKSSELLSKKRDFPDDGIDYELLGKDRSKCTPEELDQIRRERNRMHAKRTRDRKRLFMEEMAEMCKRLEDENALLQGHLESLNGVPSSSRHYPQAAPSPVSPSLPPTPSGPVPPLETSVPKQPLVIETDTNTAVSEHGVTFDQIKTLLEAAGAFSAKDAMHASTATAVSTNDSEVGSISDHDDNSSCKRRRLNHTEILSSMVSSPVPKSITAGATATVGC